MSRLQATVRKVEEVIERTTSATKAHAFDLQGVRLDIDQPALNHMLDEAASLLASIAVAMSRDPSLTLPDPT